MERTATAHWEGDLRSGTGTMRLGSGAWEGPYSFKTRFEGAPGSNPEELLGAAHAGCFSMALSAGLTKAGKKATSIDTKAVVILEGLAITRIDLIDKGGGAGPHGRRVPGRGRGREGKLHRVEGAGGGADHPAGHARRGLRTSLDRAAEMVPG